MLARFLNHGHIDFYTNLNDFPCDPALIKAHSYNSSSLFKNDAAQNFAFATNLNDKVLKRTSTLLNNFMI